jgi:molybdopterin/thiamine biosynthesis adenylyltransferase
MGIMDILAYDNDTVDMVNIATQNHGLSYVGYSKVESVAATALEYSGSIVTGINSRVERDTLFEWQTDVTISAVDSIKARQEIWMAMLRSSDKGALQSRWYIDCRMAALEYQMYVIDMHDDGAVRAYGKGLMSLNEDDIADLPCTEKATTFLGKLAAGIVGAELMHIIREEAVSRFVVMSAKTLFTHTRNI